MFQLSGFCCISVREHRDLDWIRRISLGILRVEGVEEESFGLGGLRTSLCLQNAPVLGFG